MVVAEAAAVVADVADGLDVEEVEVSLDVDSDVVEVSELDSLVEAERLDAVVRVEVGVLNVLVAVERALVVVSSSSSSSLLSAVLVAADTLRAVVVGSGSKALEISFAIDARPSSNCLRCNCVLSVMMCRSWIKNSPNGKARTADKKRKENRITIACLISNECGGYCLRYVVY